MATIENKAKRKLSNDQTDVLEHNAKKQKASDDPPSSQATAPTEPSVPTTGEKNCPRCDQCLPIDSFARKHGRTLRSRDSTICKECLKQQHLKDGKAFVCDDCNEIVDGTPKAEKDSTICKECLKQRRLKDGKAFVCCDCNRTIYFISRAKKNKDKGPICKACAKTRRMQVKKNNMLLCHGCKQMLKKNEFHKSVKRGDKDRVRCCRACTMKKVLLLCHGCKTILEKDAFTPSEWEGDAQKVRHCLKCAENPKKCHGCEKYLSKQSFSKAAWKGAEEKVRHCSTCNESRQKLLCHEARLCHGCGRSMNKYSFTKGAWAGVVDKIRFCCCCTERRRQLIWNGSGTMLDMKSSDDGVRAGHEEKVQLICTELHHNQMLCHQCEKWMDKDSFSKTALKVDGQETQICLSCSESSQQRPCIGCTKVLTKESLGNGAEKEDSQTGPQCRSYSRTHGVKIQEHNSLQQYGKVKEASDAEASYWLSMRRCHEAQKRVILRWPSSSISTTDEIAMKAKVIVRGQYARLTKAEIDNLANYIRAAPSAMTVLQACSLRRQVLKQKAIAGHVTLLRNAPQLVSLYNGGTSIVALSQRFDAPPLNVLRVIMRESGYDKFQIKRAFHRPERYFETRGLQEFKEATEADFVAPVDWTAAQKHAKHFEDCVAAYLRDKEIRFVHETQLAQEQIDILGKAFMTPDFLILDDLEINGKKVRWIDAKAYYGAATSEKLVHRTRQQMLRYIGQWGPGAIVFKHGFGEEFPTALKDCAILNAHDFLPKDQKSSEE